MDFNLNSTCRRFIVTVLSAVGMLFGFVTPAVAGPVDAVWVDGGVGSSIVSVCLGENAADTPTDKMTNCMSVIEDPVEESESGGESAMLERESSSTGPQSQGVSGSTAGEADHAHEIQMQNREMVMIAMISMLGCVILGTVIYFAIKWVADHKKSERQSTNGH